MAYYTRYEKLQKCHYDGTPFEPAEFKKGTNLGVAFNTPNTFVKLYWMEIY